MRAHAPCAGVLSGGVWPRPPAPRRTTRAAAGADLVLGPSAYWRRAMRARVAGLQLWVMVGRPAGSPLFLFASVLRSPSFCNFWAWVSLFFAGLLVLPRAAMCRNGLSLGALLMVDAELCWVRYCDHFCGIIHCFGWEESKIGKVLVGAPVTVYTGFRVAACG